MDTGSILFFAAFAATLAGLAAAVVTGLRRARRAHLLLAPSAVALLVVTILLAERLSRARVFPPRELGIHLWFAKTAALLVLPVIGTGIYLARTGRGRRSHRICVLVFLLAAATAMVTGFWVFSLSTPR